MDRMFGRLYSYLMRIFYNATSTEYFSAIIVLFGGAFLTSLLLYRSPDIAPPDVPDYDNHDYFREQSTTQKSPPTYSAERKSPQPEHMTGQRVQQTPRTSDELKLIELKAETYNGMIRLLKPGYRSIVLLVDNDSKDQLLADFRRCVWPYRRNKSLLFGYLMLDKNIEWYQTLLEQVLGCGGLDVNKKNCIGTVLSLNGFKKYLRVYHVKHHEIDYYDDETENDGSFLGFDNENDDQNDVERGTIERGNSDDLCSVNHLLDRLPIWLDKMFDGLTKRYFVDEWPENIK